VFLRLGLGVAEVAGDLRPIPQGVEVLVVGFVAAQAEGNLDLGAVVGFVGNGVGQEGGQRPAVRAGAGGAVLQQLFHPLAREGERGVDVLAGGGFPVQLGEGGGDGGELLLDVHAPHAEDVDKVRAGGLAPAGLQLHRLVRAQGQQATVDLVVGPPRAEGVVMGHERNVTRLTRDAHLYDEALFNRHKVC